MNPLRTWPLWLLCLALSPVAAAEEPEKRTFSMHGFVLLDESTPGMGELWKPLWPDLRKRMAQQKQTSLAEVPYFAPPQSFRYRGEGDRPFSAPQGPAQLTCQLNSFGSLACTDVQPANLDLGVEYTRAFQRIVKKRARQSSFR